MDGFIWVYGGEFRYFVLIDRGLFGKIFDKIKYLICKKVGLHIVLIIILKRSELLHIVLYQLKNINFS